MINAEQHINPIERAALFLTTPVFMADTHFVFLEKGKPMDEPSTLSTISHEKLVSMVANNKDRAAFKILF
ncbi:MAG: hypothetical protein P8I94_08995, partial [Emcibacteraceae bacterium]|nr:hypothetical protein [Emcibacteraceae bacterium]